MDHSLCSPRQEKSDGDSVPDRHDIELAKLLLEMTPEERLRALKRYARLRERADEQT